MKLQSKSYGAFLAKYWRKVGGKNRFRPDRMATVVGLQRAVWSLTLRLVVGRKTCEGLFFRCYPFERCRLSALTRAGTLPVGYRFVRCTITADTTYNSPLWAMNYHKRHPIRPGCLFSLPKFKKRGGHMAKEACQEGYKCPYGRKVSDTKIVCSMPRCVVTRKSEDKNFSFFENLMQADSHKKVHGRIRQTRWK